MNTLTISSAIIAFPVAVAAASFGATDHGATDQATPDEVCRYATWPMIPERCLSGGEGHVVRVVDFDVTASDQAIVAPADAKDVTAEELARSSVGAGPGVAAHAAERVATAFAVVSRMPSKAWIRSVR